MDSVKEILLRVRHAHYEDVTLRMAEAFGVTRGTAGRWFSHGSVPEFATVRAIAQRHPAMADGLLAAWEAESKQSERAVRRKPSAKEAKPIALPPDASASFEVIAELVRRYPSIAGPLAQRAKALARVERGEMDGGEARG